MAKKKEEQSSLADLMKKYNAVPLSEVKKYTTQLPVLSTGIDGLDFLLGCIDPETGTAGMRTRDILELFGKNNSFKSGTWMEMAKATIERFGPQSVVGIFSEPPDAERVEGVGINLKDIIGLNCWHKDQKIADQMAETNLEAALEFAQTPEVKLVIVDSVAMLSSDGEFYDAQGKERGLGDPVVAAKAKVLNDFIAHWFKLPMHAECACIMINHKKDPISTGFKAGGNYASPIRVETPGGRGMEFGAWIRIDCSAEPRYKDDGKHKHSVYENKVQDGLKIKYKIVKNKYAHTTNQDLVTVEFDLRTKKINNAETLLTFAKFFVYTDDNGEVKSILNPPVIQRAATYTVGSEKFRGQDAVIAYLEANPDIMMALRKQIAPHRNKFFEDNKNFTAEHTLDVIMESENE